ncbi:MAG: TraV family lipoprotein [Panacagrimonas sp.]
MNALIPYYVVLLALTACASEPRYSCGVPVSAGGCRTVSRVFEDSLKMGTAKADPSESKSVAKSDAPVAVPNPGDALLTRPRVVRVLVLPWEDEAGDLNAGGYLYLRLDRGAWTLAR